ncbi:MAG: peptidylprolyl isomerase [Kiritimatiellae bacterium]|nr:peptidylprolyl isomerase [Kiritimatiellia bacterium]
MTFSKLPAVISLCFLHLFSFAETAPESSPPEPSPSESSPSEPSQGDAVTLMRESIERQREAGRIESERDGWRTRLPKFEAVAFEAGGTYQWILETSEGDITAELYPDVAPEHVRNVLYLSLLGFYDGLNFHRIIPGFMAQGGCPVGRGTGGPGYTVNLEVSRDRLHRGPGVLSMARSQQRNSAGSQFFITFADARSLDMQYSVFGRVVEGLEVVKALEAAGNPDPRSNGVPPRKNITIERTRVVWIPEEDPNS